jgi:hypothetical protein
MEVSGFLSAHLNSLCALQTEANMAKFLDEQICDALPESISSTCKLVGAAAQPRSPKYWCTRCFLLLPSVPFLKDPLYLHTQALRLNLVPYSKGGCRGVSRRGCLSARLPQII